MKFRRKQREQADGPAAEPAAEQAPAGEPPEAGAVAGNGGESDASGPAAPRTTDAHRPRGPWDSSEVPVDETDRTAIDLGGLIVHGRPGLELRLQVDEASQQVVAVLLVGSEGAVELRPFAAPRKADIWDDIRKQIGAETARRGGTATEAEGPFGTELRVVMPVTTPEGKSATQPSRVIGIRGPRWLLRATLLGRPAMEPGRESEIEDALREVVVVRGTAAMSPGEPLPLVMPSNATPAEG